MKNMYAILAGSILSASLSAVIPNQPGFVPQGIPAEVFVEIVKVFLAEQERLAQEHFDMSLLQTFQTRTDLSSQEKKDCDVLRKKSSEALHERANEKRRMVSGYAVLLSFVIELEEAVKKQKANPFGLNAALSEDDLNLRED